MARIQHGSASRQTTRPVPTTLLLWLSCGTIGSVLFTIVYLIEGATRPDYSAWQQAISALSLGPGGWVQQVNFVAFGVIIIWTAFAWRKFLKGGVGATWYAIFRVLEGLGLIVDGFFSQDPAFGYPKGAALTAPTLHGAIHVIFAFVSIIAIVLGLFVLARRFAEEPGWRGWATYSVLTGILTIVLITVFGVLNGQHSEIAGLFERLATSLGTLWGLVFLTRLWMGTGFGSFKHQISSTRDRAAFLSFLVILSSSSQRALLDYVRQTLVTNPLLVQERYTYDRTLLHEVAGQGGLPMVELLLHLGADPNARDQLGHTPLYFVGNASHGTHGADVVRVLVQGGANVNAQERLKHCTALHMATRRGNVPVAEALLDCGADGEARDKLGDTPLHRAVKCGKTEMVAFLLSRGADVHAEGKRGMTPWQVARGASMKQLLQSSRE